MLSPVGFVKTTPTGLIVLWGLLWKTFFTGLISFLKALSVEYIRC
jgi:hypothetical protein